MNDWDKNSNRLCVECKYHSSLFGEHKCYHRDNLDKVSGSPIYNCWEMRHTGDLMFTKCTLGKLFEEILRKEKKVKWYTKFFNIVYDPKN